MIEIVFSTQDSLFPCLLSEELEKNFGFRVNTLYMFILCFLTYIQGCGEFFWITSISYVYVLSSMSLALGL